MNFIRAMMVTMLLSGVGCREETPRKPPDSFARRVANLHAFARLYGIVRWFHPSDAAAAVDWDRFASDGARLVLDAPDERTLRHVLSDLFAPVAPTSHIAMTGERFPDDAALHPSDMTGLEVVAWEHRGFGNDGVYASKRRNREAVVAASGVPFAALWQAVDASPFRDNHVRLRGKARSSGHARAQLWLRIERDDTNTFFDNMDERPIVTPTWQAVETLATVDSGATRMVFGVLTFGPGTTWYDDLELAVQVSDGSWRPIPIEDPSFEGQEPLKSWRPGIGKKRLSSIEGWRASLDHTQPASGSSSLRLEPATKILKDELFAESPNAGEAVEVDLGSGLRARIPLALYSRGGHTVGDDPSAAQRSQVARSSIATSGFDRVSGIADVIVVWNVLEHFWPYWDVVPTDWVAQLDTSLVDALDDSSIDDHVRTLERMTAAAPDGHARTTCLGMQHRAKPPFAIDVIEDQVVVTTSADKAIERGDVILTIDGRTAAEQLRADEALISGSPQWKIVRARDRFGVGPNESTVDLRVRRGSKELDVSVTRSDSEIVEKPSHPSIDRFDDGIYYVDLSRASMSSLNDNMDRLAAAPGVIFDLRGYPSSNHEILSHLLSRPDDSKGWMAIPRVIKPDHLATSFAGWELYDWDMPVLQAHINGRVAFLTGPGAISYAESVMGLVEHYHLGEIVGASTAGTNGDITEIITPTGCRTRFTGMRVTKHDGSRQHLIGIRPTIPASRTIAGVIAGRDEVLEKALAYIRAGSR